ncbi:zinc-binding dehydrogenase [Paractinoplanes durhamensis]|uniref:Uncharacterized protein n=1 Tax=Paractinoplanes durhamensis TaxID=113563 RepID=A0ABQ3YN51_9ACTN|nr:zinc-binding dehydrogenase [Actinoplanes durhamensis]GID99013.1 hypothetical protein Adu01nite_03640 [Actinoplanes durhamensis]
MDAVFDAAGQGALPDSITLRGGTTDRIITIADPTAADHGVTFSSSGTPTPEALAELARRATIGELRITVAETYPLTEAAQAQTRSATGHTRGKLILLP